MKTNPPPDRRKFADERDEMNYLYHKLLYWLYEREDRARASTFAGRLAQLLSQTSPRHDAVFPEECWSLICEARGDRVGAIKHRQNEIGLMKRLQEISRHTTQEKVVFRLYGYGDLSDRLYLLAALYHDSGKLGKAIETLEESRDLCATHGIAFDGDDMLQEYLKEGKPRKKFQDKQRTPPLLRQARRCS
jgi:hypothetical protein